VNLLLNKTKIVSTIGPPSKPPAVMKEMIEAGMKMARLIFPHGDFAAQRRSSSSTVEIEHENVRMR